MKTIKIALAGNPNAGKTTLFNGLTGSRQHVGNYPGVTVEMKEGVSNIDGIRVQIQDLPGSYSLTPYSEEERVAQEVLWKTPPDVVIDVVAASNLERNLYLALQIRELGLPLVLAFNMSDVAHTRGYKINRQVISEALDAPIVETVGHRGQGLGELLRTAADYTAKSAPDTWHLSPEVNALIDELEQSPALQGRPGQPRWLALKLLEADTGVMREVRDETLLARVQSMRHAYEARNGESLESAMAGQRYRFIGELCRRAVKSAVTPGRTFTERIDSVVLNRWLGIPIFLGMMYLVFQLTFVLGEPLMGWIESLFGWLGNVISGVMPEDSLLRSLLVDGIIGGVGGVLVFLPNILLLFLAIALLEDSGYMARAAFIMDRVMNRIGLHGKSFIPMLIGFGCSVPAIMATRTMENRRDRLVTMMVVPLMSCGARLPIYALIIPAFFAARWQAPLLWLIYIIGIVLAIASAKLLRVTMFKGETVPFIMELPSYHAPTVRGTLQHMWERGKLYIQKAGTIILGISIILWALSTFPQLPQEKADVFAQQREALAALPNVSADSLEALTAGIDNREAEAAVEHSLAGRLGKGIEPVIRPLGFDWRIGTAIVGALAAKEVFVSTLGIVYSVGEADEESDTLRDKLRENYSSLVAFCIMLFSLISAPCIATFAITRRESNSWAWALFQFFGLTAMAYVITLVVYQLGTLLG